MANFKLTVSDIKGKSVTKELKDNDVNPLLGLQIGNDTDASIVGLEGKMKVTGGSDKSGIPMRPDLHGMARKHILIPKGVGLQDTVKGLRKRKLVRGNTISEEIYQINFRYDGEMKVESPKEEVTEAPKEAPRKKLQRKKLLKKLQRKNLRKKRHRLTYYDLQFCLMHWKDTLPDWYIKKYGKQPCVNIGTAGHVDHGKTTLIQALTGSWTSVHSQELKRGITIRVGYSDAAFYKCKKCESPLGYSTEPKCPNCGKESELSRVVSFVDSPGHESLMANMLSGSALIDGAMLLVAANSKVPQPQTKEHLLALQTLGIKQIVIVQNKVDLISYQDALSNFSEITKFVKGTKHADSPIIPVSAQSSLNVDALIGAIEETIETPERDESKNTVMHVLRSFDINKPGSKIKNLKGGVIGGSLTQGKFSVGDEIEIKPGLLDDRKKSYQSIQTEIVSLGTGAGLVDSVKPGGLVAIGTKLDPSLSRSDSLIGSIIGKPDTLPENTTNVKLSINLFDMAVGSVTETKVAPIRTDELLRVNVGTAPVPAKVKKVKSNDIEVEFKRPICLFEGSNVALSRRIADRWRLIGAGIVG